MLDIEPLLHPISEAKPSGDDLKYTPLFDRIRIARKLEDKDPQGKWERETTPPDFTLVVKLTSEAIASKSKDLQLVVWLIDAWVREEGVEGLIAGLDLSRELLNRFWDSLFPEIEEGDVEPRASTLDWVGSYFDAAKSSSPIFSLRSMPLTNDGHSWFVYEESRKIGYEADAGGTAARKAARVAAIKDNKISPEVFDKDFETTNKVFYKDLKANLKVAESSLAQLDEVCREKFKNFAPSFAPLRLAIEEVANVVHILLLKKLQKDPDPVEAAPAAAVGSVPDASGEQLAAEAPPLDLAELQSGAISSETQAMLHVVAAAQFIRRRNPASPASYLLLRALRWGELRAAGDVTQADLPAPQPDVRRILRTGAAAGNWKHVLESAETAMSNACGRGWLDLQRYSIRACTELGYAAAAKAIRAELKSLLLDFPTLTSATLNDDTGAANPETLEWLKQEGLTS